MKKKAIKNLLQQLVCIQILKKYSDKKKYFIFFLFLKYKLYFNLAINRHKNICERIFLTFSQTHFFI